jgi:hypothetical protein
MAMAEQAGGALGARRSPFHPFGELHAIGAGPGAAATRGVGLPWSHFCDNLYIKKKKKT